MRKTSLLIAILLFSFCLPELKSQEMEFHGGTGLFHSSMSGLRSYQIYQLYNLDVDAVVTDDFPANVYYTGEVRIHFDRFWTGLAYVWNSTGSRISYGDYSGELTMDILANAHFFGMTYGYSIYQINGLSINPLLKVLISYSDYLFTDYTLLLNEENTITHSYESESAVLVPGLELNYNRKFLSLSLSAGYLLDGDSKLHKPDDVSRVFTYPSEKPVTNNWSGYRIEVLAGFKF